MKIFLSKYILYFALFLSLSGTFGSLYFSEIRHFAPCVLCWYQRILLYPISILIPVGILLKDKKLPFYILPLSLIGTGVALYHELLQTGVINEAITPCSFGVSCTAKYVNWFGFISIPFLSLIAFILISLCMIIYRYLSESV